MLLRVMEPDKDTVAVAMALVRVGWLNMATYAINYKGNHLTVDTADDWEYAPQEAQKWLADRKFFKPTPHAVRQLSTFDRNAASATQEQLAAARNQPMGWA